MRTNAVFISRETSPKVSLLTPPYDDTYEGLQGQSIKPPVVQPIVRSKPAENPDLNKTDLARKLVTSFSDSLIRSFIRIPEKEIENNLLRGVFRLSAEVPRKIAEGSLVNILQDKKVTKEVYTTAFKRAFENAAASTIFEPNKTDSRLKRVGLGFANMLVRIATRIGMYVANVIESDEVGLDNFSDDLFARTTGRVLSTSSDSVPMKLIAGTFEQFFINSSLHIIKPINRFINFIKPTIRPFINRFFDRKPSISLTSS